MTKRRLFSFILAFLPSSLFSQSYTPWTLENCIDYAVNHNISIKRKELLQESKQVSLDESKWAFSPSLSFNSNASLSTGRVLDATTYQFIQNSTVINNSSSISGSIILFNGFKKLHTLRRAKLDLLAEESSIKSQRYEIRKNVIAAFLSLLCAEYNYASAQKVQDLLYSQLERMAILVESGIVTDADYLQAKSQLFAAESDVVTTECLVESAKLCLCQLLEIRDYDSFEIYYDDSVSITPPLLISNSIDDIVRARPEYRFAELNVELALYDVSIAKSAFYPTLSLSAGYGSSWSSAREKSIMNEDGTLRFEAYPFFDQYWDNSNSYISISLDIPIFSSFTTRNSIRKKKIAVHDTEYALQEKKKELSKEFIQADIDCRTAYKKYVFAEQQVQFAEEAERQVRERYFGGLTDFNSWNTAIIELAKARYDYSEAKYTFLLQVKILELFCNYMD